jgi:hypothetical protein
MTFFLSKSNGVSIVSSREENDETELTSLFESVTPFSVRAEISALLGSWGFTLKYVIFPQTRHV